MIPNRNASGFVVVAKGHAPHGHVAQGLARVLAAFIDACVRNVEGTGGQVAKFITGICMAYWPGPFDTLETPPSTPLKIPREG